MSTQSVKLSGKRRFATLRKAPWIDAETKPKSGKEVLLSVTHQYTTGSVTVNLLGMWTDTGWMDEEGGEVLEVTHWMGNSRTWGCAIREQVGGEINWGGFETLGCPRRL